MGKVKEILENLNKFNESEEFGIDYSLDMIGQKVYIGDNVVHCITNAFRSEISSNVGQVTEIKDAGNKIQFKGQDGRKRTVPYYKLVKIAKDAQWGNKKPRKQEQTDERPVLNHNMYDLGLQDVWVKQ